MDNENSALKKTKSADGLMFNREVKLLFGRWRSRFSADKTKFLVAESLNIWTAKNPQKLQLNGYLINNNCVYLIIKMNGAVEDLLFDSLCEIMRNMILKHQTSVSGFNADDNFNAKILSPIPFIKTTFYNIQLVKMLTGKTVKSTFYDPELERLKGFLKNYNYCSVINYAGGEGPVEVKLIEKLDK